MEQVGSESVQTGPGRPSREVRLGAGRRHVEEEDDHGTDGHDERDHDLAAWLHGDPAVAKAQSRLLAMFGELLEDAAQAGVVRDDVPPQGLATYCLHALNAASTLSSRAAAHHLVQVTLDGVRGSDH